MRLTRRVWLAVIFCDAVNNKGTVLFQSTLDSKGSIFFLFYLNQITHFFFRNEWTLDRLICIVFFRLTFIYLFFSKILFAKPYFSWEKSIQKTALNICINMSISYSYVINLYWLLLHLGLSYASLVLLFNSHAKIDCIV